VLDAAESARETLAAVTRALACLAVVLLAACPERKRPERGTQLLYAKRDGAPSPREALERRFARANLTARLSEDETRLTVRVAEGGDVAAVKAMVAVPGRLVLCPSDEATARAFCGRATARDVEAQRYGDTDLCRLAAPTEAALKAAVGDARVSYERVSGGVVAHARGDDCLAPRLTAGERKGDERIAGAFPVSVTFDARSARELEALTRRSLGRPLLVLLDDRVLFAPLVQDAITGGRLMLGVPGADAAEADRLLTAIVGGPVEGLTFEREVRYGPPSLR
jgi:preprotein translocase subunit SecD